ncbi:MAG: hypothetical protein CL890_00690 [Dehalococcoidia bacterium]|nr:hypothetical protein [Dehalococcoidia bacterium]
MFILGKSKSFLLLLILFMFNFSCSSGEDSSGEGIILGKKISNSVTYNLEDFTSSPVKFKKLKEYDVDELNYAKNVYYGFRKFEDPVDYEIRFFDSHEDALLGEELVRERAGTKEEIKLDKNEAVFTEGLKDVRHCFGEAQGEGGVAGGGAGIGGHCINSKYRNYVIQGNIILLCQGMDMNASFRNCEKLLNLLDKE